MKKLKVLLMALVIFLGFSQVSFAGKVVIIYTGETHAALYPCHCPVEPFGGLARRAAKINELRRSYPDLLLVDSGGFFAGGQLDEYSTSEALDKQRTEINLQALKIMGYDALAIGDEELNYGKDFLEGQIEKTKLPFISCNVKVKGAQGYLVKTIAGVKIGILAVTPQAQSLTQAQILDPLESISSSVKKLKSKEKVDLIILLSHPGEQIDAQLLQQIKGIDFIVTGHSIFGQDKETRIGNDVLVRPMWQGRKLGKLEMEIENGKLMNYSADWIGLGKDVPDEPRIKALLPECFSERDCLKPGFKGQCRNPGSQKAQCAYQGYPKIPLLAVQPRGCRTCNSGPFLSFLRSNFPGIEIKFLDTDNELASQLIRQFSIDMLPAYFAGKEIEKEEKFTQIKQMASLKGDYYWFSPAFSGVSYFMNRPAIENKLDLFLIINSPGMPKILETVRAFLNKNMGRFNFQIHFVVGEDKKSGLVSPAGQLEIEEDGRLLCVEKYFPAGFWDYMICRAKNIGSAWWEDCLSDKGKILSEIKECAKGQEAKELLIKSIQLTRELQVPYGPLFLLDNKEVFGINERTTVEELERFIK